MNSIIIRPTIIPVERDYDDHDSDDADDTDDEVVVVAPGFINGTVSLSLLQTSGVFCGTTSVLYLFTGAAVAPDDVD